MNKELFVSSTPHETRLALSEEGQIAEIYYEREKEYSLAGAIYKGRVTRVLPGMQSAFVDIGLERDAFLYVSDFFEDSDEYDRVVSEAENAVARLERPPEPPLSASVPPAPAPEGEMVAASEPAPAPPLQDPSLERRGRRGRHRGRRGRGSIPEEKFARPESGPAPTAEPPLSDPAPAEPPSLAAAFVLPGESLAKYRSTAPFPSSHEPPPPPRVSAPDPPPPTPPIAASALVMPGESLAKYRHREPPVPAAPPSWNEYEAGGPAEAAAGADRPGSGDADSQPDSPFASEAAVAPLPDDPDEGSAFAPEPLSDPFSGDEPDSALEEEILDGPETSASVRSSGGEAYLQAPARRSDPPRDGRRRRRRRRGGESLSEPSPVPSPDSRRDAPREPRNESSRLISDLLHEGQEILVQIAKEPLGKKGARITSHLALPGRYLVYMPTVHHIGVSRRIGSDEERARLKRIILDHTQGLPGGFIVRTAGAGAREEELLADIRLLSSQWNDLRQQFEQVRAPALLHHDLNLVERTLRDHLSGDFTHIWVDAEEQFQRVVKFVGFFMPELVDRVRLYTREEPMFEHFAVQEEINKALQSKVWLKSGGYIVLNQTEALVAIDVNTGKYVGKSNRLEDTIVKTNVEAIREIVRQIRLRDLGGIIVIDFIDMDERRNRQKVMQALEEAMRADRAPSKVLAFNDFGLVALTRKRVKQSLERTLGSPCPYCEGVGLVKSPVTVANEIYLEVKRVAPTLERDDMVLRVHPEVARVLKDRGAQRLRELEDVTRKGISVRPDPGVHQERFEIY